MHTGAMDSPRALGVGDCRQWVSATEQMGAGPRRGLQQSLALGQTVVRTESPFLGRSS